MKQLETVKEKSGSKEQQEAKQIQYVITVPIPCNPHPPSIHTSIIEFKQKAGRMSG